MVPQQLKCMNCQRQARRKIMKRKYMTEEAAVPQDCDQKLQEEAGKYDKWRYGH
jgi:hypothetical protein